MIYDKNYKKELIKIILNKKEEKEILISCQSKEFCE
jgi:hypothetical protein